MPPRYHASPGRLLRPVNRLLAASTLRALYLLLLIRAAYTTARLAETDYLWWILFGVLVVILVAVALLSVSSWIGEFTSGGPNDHRFDITTYRSLADAPLGTMVWLPPFVCNARVVFGRTLMEKDLNPTSVAAKWPEFHHVFLEYPLGGLDELYAFPQVIHYLNDNGLNHNVVWRGLSYGCGVARRLAAYNDSMTDSGVKSVAGLIIWSDSFGIWGIKWPQRVMLFALFAFTGGPLFDWLWGKGLWKSVRPAGPVLEHLRVTRQEYVLELIHASLRNFGPVVLYNLQALTSEWIAHPRRPRPYSSQDYPVIVVNLPQERDGVVKVKRGMKLGVQVFPGRRVFPTLYFFGEHGQVTEHSPEVAGFERRELLPLLKLS